MFVNEHPISPWTRTPWWLFWRKRWRQRVEFTKIKPVSSGFLFDHGFAWRYCDDIDFLTMD